MPALLFARKRDRSGPPGASDDFARTLRDIDRITKRIRSQTRKAGSGQRRVLLARSVLVAFALLMLFTLLPPLRYPVPGTVSSRFFVRRKPDSWVPIALEFHDGLDIAAPAGTRVVAAAPGVVTAVGEDAVSGKYVRIHHFLGVSTFYAHLSAIRVGKGQVVLLRSVRALGAVGSTGRSTGPHLHFEVILGRRSVPPSPFLFFHALRTRILGG